MLRKILQFCVVIVSLFGVQAMAIEEPKYSLVSQEGKFEVRDYQPYLLAEVTVEAEFEEAGSKAFRALFKYISGDNTPQSEIAMTAPVTQQPAGVEIAMTAPVTQSGEVGRYVVSFTMPASYSLATLPEPTDPRVVIRQVAAQRMAVVTYSGTRRQSSYEAQKQALQQWLAQKGYEPVGVPVWARYNAPFSLWFLRRNEIQIPIKGG